eukprot:11588759-Karenia_brevis.AAC.1
MCEDAEVAGALNAVPGTYWLVAFGEDNSRYYPQEVALEDGVLNDAELVLWYFTCQGYAGGWYVATRFQDPPVRQLC